MGLARGQVSLEYMIITGFIVFAILVPSFLILYNSTTRGVHDTVSSQKTVDLGKGLVNDAKQMYYLGIYSRKIVSYEIPDNVETMWLLRITHASKDYYYLGISTNDGRGVQTFMSDVPLTSESGKYVNDGDPSLNSLVSECTQLGYICHFYSFIDNAIKPGQKKFKIETVYINGAVESSIIPILT